VKAKKDRVTGHDLHHDEEKEKALKTGYITLYTKLFTVTDSIILSTGYVTLIAEIKRKVAEK